MYILHQSDTHFVSSKVIMCWHLIKKKSIRNIIWLILRKVRGFEVSDFFFSLKTVSSLRILLRWMLQRIAVHYIFPSDGRGLVQMTGNGTGRRPPALWTTYFSWWPIQILVQGEHGAPSSILLHIYKTEENDNNVLAPQRWSPLNHTNSRWRSYLLPCWTWFSHPAITAGVKPGGALWPCGSSSSIIRADGCFCWPTCLRLLEVDESEGKQEAAAWNGGTVAHWEAQWELGHYPGQVQ